MKYALFIILVAMLAICGGCTKPSQKAVYNASCEAIKQDANFPKDAKLASLKETEMYIAKNAASAELPYEYTNPQGLKMAGSYTIWLKRIARTWTVDKYFPTPKYQP